MKKHCHGFAIFQVLFFTVLIMGIIYAMMNAMRSKATLENAKYVAAQVEAAATSFAEYAVEYTTDEVSVDYTGDTYYGSDYFGSSASSQEMISEDYYTQLVDASFDPADFTITTALSSDA